MMTRHSFNEDFCDHLEYHLTRTFRHSMEDAVKDFCCDGVSMPFLESELSKESVRRTRKIATTGWLGHDGQQEFDLIVHFGTRAMIAYENGTDLEDCLPDETSMQWIHVDKYRKVIEIQLE